MSKQIKKDYIVRVYQDGQVIDEVKLTNSKKKILVHKYDKNESTLDEVIERHNHIQSLHPKLQILSIPKSSEVEIWEVQ